MPKYTKMIPSPRPITHCIEMDYNELRQLVKDAMLREAGFRALSVPEKDFSFKAIYDYGSSHGLDRNIKGFVLSWKEDQK